MIIFGEKIKKDMNHSFARTINTMAQEVRNFLIVVALMITWIRAGLEVDAR